MHILNIDPARSRAWDPRLSLARASTAYARDPGGTLRLAPADAPRLDHRYDAASGLWLPGLRVEAAATNLLTYAEQFDAAAWTKLAATVTANAAPAPDGITTADKIVETSATSAHGIYQSVSKAATAITYSFSVRAKAAERSTLRLLLEGSASGSAAATFDLAAGTAGTATVSGAFTGQSSGISAVGGGWYLCWLTATSNTDAGLYADFYMGAGTYAGDGASGLYLWGAQLEAGSYPTSYVPATTPGSQNTRAAETCTLPLSSVPGWNASEGTVYVAGRTPRGIGSAAQVALQFDDGSDANRIALYRSSSRVLTVLISSGGVTVATLSLGAVNDDTDFRIGVRWRSDDFAAAVNGGVPVTDTAGAAPAGLSTLRLGSDRTSSGRWDGWLYRVAAHPRGLSNTELQTITG